MNDEDDDGPIILHGPITLELKVTAYRPSDLVIAKVTIGMPAGRYPTREEIEARMASAVDQLNKQIPGEGDAKFRLATKHEWFNDWMREDQGGVIVDEEDGNRVMVFAAPGGDDWDK